MLPTTPGTNVDTLNNDTAGAPEQSYVVCAADAGVFEQFTVVFGAGDEIGQGEFLHFVDPSGVKFAVWFDVDAAGTAPNGPIYVAADEKIEVDIVLTGTPSTVVEVAAAVVIALAANVAFTEYDVVDNLDGSLTFTANLLGNPANAAGYAEAETASTTIVETVDAGGVASSLQNKYIEFKDNDDDAFYAWFNVNAEGVDPAPAGTGIEVAIATGATAAQVATALAAAIEADSEFTASADGSRVKIVTVGVGAATDIGAGDSGFTVSVQSDGRAAKKPAPADATSSLTNV